MAALGGENHFLAIAARFDPVADDHFRLAAFVAGNPFRINIGGIDEVEIDRKKTIENPE